MLISKLNETRATSYSSYESARSVADSVEDEEYKCCVQYQGLNESAISVYLIAVYDKTNDLDFLGYL